MLVMARVIEKEQGDVDRALEMNRQILEIDEGNEQALDALERLYLGKGQFQELLDIYEKKLELTDRRRRADRDPVEDRPALRGRGQGRQEGDRRVPRRSSTPPATSRPRCARSIASTCATGSGRSSPTSSAGSSRSSAPRTTSRARRAEVPPRPGQGAAPRRRRRARSTRTATSSTSMPAHARGARRARGAPRAGDDKQHSSPSPGILEPVYEQLSEWAPLVGVHEIQLAAEKDSLRKTSLLLRIGELQRTQAARRREGVRRVRARVPRGSVDRGREGAARGARRRSSRTAGPGWSSFTRTRSIEGKDLDPRLAHELATKVARSYEDRLGNSDKAVEFYQARRSRSSPTTSARSPRSRRSSPATRSSPSCSRSIAAASTSRSEPDERLEFLFRIASLHEEMLNNQDEAIATYNEILGQSPDDLKSLRALDRLYVAARRVARPRRQHQPPAHARRSSPHEQVAPPGPPRAAARDAPRARSARPSRRTARCSSSRTRTATRSPRSSG